MFLLVCCFLRPLSVVIWLIYSVSGKKGHVGILMMGMVYVRQKGPHGHTGDGHGLSDKKGHVSIVLNGMYCERHNEPVLILLKVCSTDVRQKGTCEYNCDGYVLCQLKRRCGHTAEWYVVLDKKGPMDIQVKDMLCWAKRATWAYRWMICCVVQKWAFGHTSEGYVVLGKKGHMGIQVKDMLCWTKRATWAYKWRICCVVQKGPHGHTSEGHVVLGKKGHMGIQVKDMLCWAKRVLWAYKKDMLCWAKRVLWAYR